MIDENVRIRTALFSVSDKAGVPAFALFLQTEFDVEILSTGGTAKVLRDANVRVTDVSEHTGFPECFGGRVKTLHPMIHGGLLYQRENPADVQRAKELKIGPIDLVVVNLYPFAETAKKPGVTTDEVIENIDIGGPSMIRSAAKNHASVAVATERGHYAYIQNQMVERQGCVGPELRRLLAGDAFRLTAAYDTAIANHEYFSPPTRV